MPDNITQRKTRGADGVSDQGSAAHSPAWHAMAPDSVSRDVRRWLRQHKWGILFVLLLVPTVVLGIIGFSQYARDATRAETFWDSLYLVLQLFVLQSGSGLGHIGWELEVARFLAAVLALYAAIQALALIFHEQLQRLWVRLSYRDHIVICGLGGIGHLLAERFKDEKEKVVVIEKDAENDFIKPAREQGAIVLTGNATDPTMLRRAGVPQASSLIAVCGNDGTNAEIACLGSQLAQPGPLRSRVTRIRNVVAHNFGLPTRGPALRCFAHVLNTHLCHYLNGQAITTRAAEYYQLEFFNIHESGARILLDMHPFDRGVETSPRQPHVLIIGLGGLGQSLLLRAERRWRERYQRTGEKLCISMIDAAADGTLQLLRLEHPHLEQTCHLNPLQRDVRLAAYLDRWPPFNERQLAGVTHIYICLEDDSTALTVAFILAQHTRTLRIPIVVCLSMEGAGLAGLISERVPDDECPDAAPGCEKLVGFGLLDQTCQPELLRMGLYEDLATAIHRRFQAAELAKGRSPDDTAMADWEQLDSDYRESNRRQARALGASLWKRGYGIEALTSLRQAAESKFDETRLIRRQDGRQETELDFLARNEHESWLKQKQADDWTYGSRRDETGKRNPDIRPWDELSEASREKNRDIVRGWPELLASVDLQIYRRQ